MLQPAQPGTGRRRQPGVLDQRLELAALVGRHRQRGRRLDHRGEVHGRGEERAPHAEHPHDGAIVVEGPLDGGRVGVGHADERGEHDRGGIGGVEHHDRAGDRGHVVVDAGARGQPVADASRARRSSTPIGAHGHGRDRTGATGTPRGPPALSLT